MNKNRNASNKITRILAFIQLIMTNHSQTPDDVFLIMTFTHLYLSVPDNIP